jgi:hypothetical protein
MALGACSSTSKSASPTSTTSATTATTSVTTSALGGGTSLCAPSSSAGAGQGGKDVTPPGDIPDNQAFVAFQPPAGEYRIEVPEGWARTDSAGAVRFTDKFNSITIEAVPAPSAPTAASAQAGEVPKVRASATCFEGRGASTVVRRSGPAVLITYRADTPPDPVTGKVARDDVERYEFWKTGREAVITLASPLGSDNVDPWRRITDSFSWAS